MQSRPTVQSTALCTLALAGSVALYAPTIHAGFVWDDYHFIRPYSLAEVLGSFRGSWDVTHVEVGFYRPLAVFLAALRFQAFGYSPAPYHVMSIVLFALAAALFGGFVLRFSRRFPLALVGVGLFLAHPAMTDSLAAWVTNQFQLFQIIVFLGALHWWLTVRGRSIAWWLPFIAFEGACFLLKEDGIMLLPALLLTELIWRGVRDQPRTLPRSVFAIGGITSLLLILVRRLALHTTLAGYGLPPVNVGLHRMLLGPALMLTGSFGTGWARYCSMILIGGITLAGGVAVSRGRYRHARFLVLMGAAIMACFGVPVYLAGRDFLLPWHFLALGHVCILLGCVQALYEEGVSVSLPVRFENARAALRLRVVPGPLPLASARVQDRANSERFALAMTGSVGQGGMQAPATSDVRPAAPAGKSALAPWRPASIRDVVLPDFRDFVPTQWWRHVVAARLPRFVVRGAVAVLVVFTLSLMALIVRQETHDWSGSSPRVQCTDRRVKNWGDTVPQELRQALARKNVPVPAVSDEACAVLFPS